MAMIVGTMQFRDKLPILMEQQRFEASDVAKAAEVSLSQAYAWFSKRPEDANRKPTYVQLLKIARLFKVTMESLAADEMDPVPSELPADEVLILQTYRIERDEHGLEPAKAIRRLQVPPDREGLQPRRF